MLQAFGITDGGNKVAPITSADSFFGKPELQEQMVERNVPTRCAAGVLALRVPDPPSYAPPSVCAISKDGKIAAVGGKDVELYLWSTDSGDLLSTLRGHEIAWTSSNDNTFFVTVQEDSKVFIWDQHELRQRQLLGHPDEPLTCCSVSLDDMYVVVGGARGTVYSWDADSGVEYRQCDDGHVGPVSCVMCYPMVDGTHVVISCGAADHTVVVWDLESSSKRNSILIDELEHAKNVRYHVSKDGTQVVCWCTDSVPFPNLVFVDALNSTKNSVFCHDGLVRHATFAKDAAKIISCGSDGKIVLWDTATLEPQITLTGHVGNVLCCGINEEGSRIVSSGEDCTVRVWSTEDGLQLMRMEAQDEPIKYCAFAKSATSNKILTCDVTGRVYVWNILSEVIASLIRRFADNISCTALSNDSRLLAAGCNNGRVMLWDAEMRENIWEYSHHTGRVEAVAFNSLHDAVATAGADGRISIIAVDSGKQLNSFSGTEEPIMTLSFSPDDEKVAGTTADGKLLVYELISTSRTPRLTLASQMARITGFVWSPNSKLIAGCGSDGCVMVWNATTGSIFTVLEGTATATVCTFDLVGKLLAVGNVLGRTVLYNLETAEELCELRGNASAIVDVVFSQDTSRLTTICSRQAIIWDTSSATKVRIYDFVVDKQNDFTTTPHPFRTTVAHSGTVLFDAESEALVYDMVPIDDPLLRSFYLSDTRIVGSGASNYRRTMVWSAAGNSGPDKFHTTHDAITSCHFSLDERLVVMGTQDGNIVVYDVLHNETVEVINAHQNGPCRCVRFSYDNSQVLSSGADAKVILWDWRSRTAARIFSGHFISVGACDIAFQDHRVCSGDNHGMISVYEKDTGNMVQTLPLAHARAVLAVSISSDGSTVASVGADDKVAIWNVDEGVELVSLTAAIESHPLYCCFSADGNKLAVTESNGNVMVWNAIAGCQWYQIPQAHKGKVTACAWSFDCRRFVTAGTDSIMAVWDAESGAPLFKFQVKSGALTTVAVSPKGQYVAGGSVTGTLSVCSIPQAARQLPEPSFLYHWLAIHEPKPSALLYAKLISQHPHLPNVQDAQGWSLINHMVTKGNATVATIVLESAPLNCGNLALISAVPFTIQTRVTFHQPGEDGYDAEGNPAESIAARIKSVSAGTSGRIKSSAALNGSKSFSGALRQGNRSGRMRPSTDKAIEEEEENLEGVQIQKSTRSFTNQIKKVAVELFVEKRDMDHMELIMNNALALALNSKSSECVQVVLDAAAQNKVSWGSYHAITDMIPSLAVRYPYMCYQFLAQLELVALGDLEVPVAVMRGLDSSVIRTAPIFTNVRNLWQSHLKLHEVKSGPQPYAHVKASMVRLPFACALGKESLLQTLVESDVPVQAYGTPTLRAVIRHKWRLYARSKLVLRAIQYFFYTIVFTIFGVIYSMEDHNLGLSDYWESGGRARYHLISGAYLWLQAAFFAWKEGVQLYEIGLRLYFKSGWNVLDVTSIMFMLVIIPLHFARAGDKEGSVLAPLIAFEVIMTWFKVFFYALAFETTGPVVHMVFQISWAVSPWAVLLFMNMVSFGTSLMVLYQYTTSDPGFMNFGRALFSLWNAIFGIFDMSANLTDGGWGQLAIIFFSAFLFLSNIVLLNMLIALMRDIYQRVRDTEQDVFLRGRAQHIVEVETLMSTAQQEFHSLMPPYVHMLTEVQRKVHNSDSLLGRLDRLEAMFHGMAEQLEKLLRNAGINVGKGLGGPIVTGAHTGGEAGMAAVAGIQGTGAGGMGMPNALMMMPPPPGIDPAAWQQYLQTMAAMGGQGMGGADGMNAMFPGMMAAGMMGPGGMMGGSIFGGMGGMLLDPTTGAPMNPQEQLNLLQVTAQRIKESESQLPAILRQLDRLQRTINNQEMRMEGVVIVLRDIENLLRNQQPVIIHQETRPAAKRGTVLTEAELELEVKRLLGKNEGKL